MSVNLNDGTDYVVVDHLGEKVLLNNRYLEACVEPDAARIKIGGKWHPFHNNWDMLQDFGRMCVEAGAQLRQQVEAKGELEKELKLVKEKFPTLACWLLSLQRRILKLEGIKDEDSLHRP